MKETLKKIFSDVFQVDPAEVNSQFSTETSQKWDSLGHLRLVYAIEQAFRVQLTTQEILEMLNFQKVMEILEQHQITE